MSTFLLHIYIYRTEIKSCEISPGQELREAEDNAQLQRQAEVP